MKTQWKTVLLSIAVDLAKIFLINYFFMKQQNSLTFSPNDHRGEVNERPSKTIPDQSLTIRDLINRHTRGLPLEGGRVPVYEEEDDDLSGVEFSKLDLVDQQELREQYKSELDEINKKFADGRKQKEDEEKQRRAKEDEDKKDYEEWKRSRRNSGQGNNSGSSSGSSQAGQSPTAGNS